MTDLEQILIGEIELYMSPTTNQKKLISDFSQLVYNWRNKEDIDNILTSELIIEDVSQMDLSDTDRTKVIGIFKQLLEIIRKNE